MGGVTLADKIEKESKLIENVGSVAGGAVGGVIGTVVAQWLVFIQIIPLFKI